MSGISAGAARPSKKHRAGYPKTSCKEMEARNVGKSHVQPTVPPRNANVDAGNVVPSDPFPPGDALGDDIPDFLNRKADAPKKTGRGGKTRFRGRVSDEARKIDEERGTKTMNDEISTTLPAQVGLPKVPAALRGLLDSAKIASGFGVSDAIDDALLPLLTVLQTGSPQCNARGNEHIADAKPGSFWLRNSTTPIRDGEAGIIVSPLMMMHTWNEWKPDRGGFVASHSERPTDLEIIDDGDRNFPRLIRTSTRNNIEESRNFWMLIHGSNDVEGCMMPCTGTKHTFAKSWNQEFKQCRDEDGYIFPPFVRKYRLTTRPEKNTLGNWFGLKFETLGFASEEECREALAWAQTIPQQR
jgi:hypothetical protein